jgi:hypothetical protein
MTQNLDGFLKHFLMGVDDCRHILNEDVFGFYYLGETAYSFIKFVALILSPSMIVEIGMSLARRTS